MVRRLMRRSLLSLALGLALASPIAHADDGVDERLADVEQDLAHGTPPQPERVNDLFRRAHPADAPAFRGLLICAIRVPGEDWDGSDPFGPVRRFMGRIDLNAIVRVEGNVVARWYGPEDQSTALVALPGLALERGNRLVVDVEDRDVVRDDAVGRVEATYEGSLPLRASSGRVEVECRGTPAEQLATRVDAAAANADQAMDALPDAEHPDAAVLHFHRSEDDERAARLAVYDLARWVGLGDPRVTSRLAELDDRRQRFKEHVAELVGRLRADAPAPDVPVRVPGSPWSVTVRGLVCDLERLFELRREAGLDTRMTCALRLHVAHEASSPQTLGFTMHVVDELGETTEVHPILLEEADGASRFNTRTRFPRGGRDLVLALEERSPVLLRLSTRSGVTWARIEGDGNP